MIDALIWKYTSWQQLDLNITIFRFDLQFQWKCLYSVIDKSHPQQKKMNTNFTIDNHDSFFHGFSVEYAGQCTALWSRGEMDRGWSREKLTMTIKFIVPCIKVCFLKAMVKRPDDWSTLTCDKKLMEHTSMLEMKYVFRVFFLIFVICPILYNSVPDLSWSWGLI